MAGAFKVNEKRGWATSPSGALYHFGTSGISVAVATGLTHPLGSFFFLSIFPSVFLDLSKKLLSILLKIAHAMINLVFLLNSKN